MYLRHHNINVYNHVATIKFILLLAVNHVAFYYYMCYNVIYLCGKINNQMAYPPGGICVTTAISYKLLIRNDYVQKTESVQ